ncbi:MULTISPECIES: hypothetical protein [unclassified Agrobacterium]|jgi:hypothetical protein|nr:MULTISPECIES: hypothetical protein [unclassified Agrobacterium]MDH0613953.1 hypothetical protein [Agrobacterium sp. GD03872]MDH0696842.1 hypothetical protein [Agrobacterium sp. GD03871]MDH1059994.1 hypothetical protein [Agrobacterium sp. GD03992]MDH2209907.1 hypothetical protein [Agrobacterium sp. GD03643]MDH2219406.1 hypothetical protein [Agrobacterium sp. GD03638]
MAAEKTPAFSDRAALKNTIEHSEIAAILPPMAGIAGEKCGTP